MSRGEPYPRWIRVAWSAAGVVLGLGMYGGALAAAAGWHAGLAIALGGAGFLFLVHLAIGIVGYRRTMASEWPRVAPLDDDEWE